MTFMKKIILLALILAGLFYSPVLSAQAKDKEKEAITSTLMHYIEGTSDGFPDRIKKAFHPDLNLYSVNADGTLKTWNGKDYISRFKPGVKNNRVGKILMIDRENDAATAKVEIKMGERLYIDYFLLLKLEGTWTIIHKSYTRKN
ncbi:MAG: nuclear transport factor 2 family protein [Bacteroidota bacterium]